MRLTELNPRWFTFIRWSGDSPFILGITFDCPHCKEERLAILFDPPIDPGTLQERLGFPYDPMAYGAAEGKTVWKREGDTFETLTLTPSIDASAHGHWHGFIQQGAIV